MKKFYVMSKQKIDGSMTTVVETIRSGDEKLARKAAEKDVSLLKDIIHRNAWIDEVNA